MKNFDISNDSPAFLDTLVLCPELGRGSRAGRAWSCQNFARFASKQSHAGRSRPAGRRFPPAPVENAEACRAAHVTWRGRLYSHWPIEATWLPERPPIGREPYVTRLYWRPTALATQRNCLFPEIHLNFPPKSGSWSCSFDRQHWPAKTSQFGLEKRPRRSSDWAGLHSIVGTLFCGKSGWTLKTM